MTQLSVHSEIREFINGVEIDSSLEIREFEILASSDNATGLNFSVERITLVRNAYTAVRDYIEAGNIFEGLSYRIEIFNNQYVNTLDFWLDLTDDVIDFFPQRAAIEVKATLKDGNGELEEKLTAITFEYLESIEVITDADYIDVDYVVEKIVEVLELATTIIVGYVTLKAIIDRIRDLAKNSATTAGIGSSGILGPVGAAIFAALVIAIEIIYTAGVVLALVELVRSLLSYFIQPTRTHKGILLKTLLEKAAQQIGYSLETDIEDLDNLVYLPSNTSVDSIDANGFINIPGTIKKGIPRQQDYGNSAIDAFNIVRFYANAVLQVVDKTIQIRSKNSEYWIMQSTYTLEDVKNRPKRYNTQDLFASKEISFDTDLQDDFTIDNFKGTNFAIATDIKTPINANSEGKFVKGREEIRIPLALGSVKDNFTPLENLLKSLASIADNAINVLGGNSKLVNLITRKKGVLKVSRNNHARPKLLWIENGRIPLDHRDKLSARVSHDKYHVYDSFVSGDGQKLLFNQIEIPFGYRDFLSVFQNSYFRDSEGRSGQILSLRWRPLQDTAIADYRIFERYTENLKETFIEPE